MYRAPVSVPHNLGNDTSLRPSTWESEEGSEFKVIPGYPASKGPR